MIIIKNRAKCLKCNEILESKHRHDFVTCSCNNLSVDGGHSYLKRNYLDGTQIEEMSTTKEDLINKVKKIR